MTLCLPFLMFQGRAAEAVELYLEAFPDAELLEMQHHPEGTEILDLSAEVDEDLGEKDAADDGEGPEEDEASDAEGETAAEDSGEEAHPRTGSDLAPVPADAPEPHRLVASAQITIGGQVLMIQDSLVTHEFGFTPSTSIAVVVESSGEFDGIVSVLAQEGTFLMEPGDYDFAKNFAWIQDRFGVCWQVNHPLSAPEEETAQTKAPDWG
ncbi:VOC family protein [Nesterenkonia sp. F]|uniref:VOC family protein n=1 Tax=Nesterenkonia sp. F TaxID=795955 RepID=UPI000310E160|nr:VOC family protein [Nesterenkonia sp. F]